MVTCTLLSRQELLRRAQRQRARGFEHVGHVGLLEMGSDSIFMVRVLEKEEFCMLTAERNDESLLAAVGDCRREREHISIWLSSQSLCLTNTQYHGSNSLT